MIFCNFVQIMFATLSIRALQKKTPYDGCGYYSVFVEINLNLASTVSGRRLYSEEEIADYIAGMMVLEVEPYFYIECAGTYQGNSTEFYEFRCYR